MAAINKIVDINYKGKSYDCIGNFEFINRVEQRLNVALFEAQATAGSPKVSDMAWIIFCALRPHIDKLEYFEVGDEMLSDMEYYGQVVGDLIQATFSAAPMEAEGGGKGGNKKKA